MTVSSPRTQVGDTQGLRFTHPERVFYEPQGITKLKLADYYIQVCRWMLPHLRNRPLTLVRCPEGQDKHCFYQKHAKAGMPDAIHRIVLEEKQGPATYTAVSDLEGLLSLVQIGVLEIHTWGARADKPDYPDQLVFDLDPDPELPWERVIDAGFEIRHRLRALGLSSFAKTTGGKGLHVVVPVLRHLNWDETKAFCKAVAVRLAHEKPNEYVAVMTKEKRRGKVFVDYLRNARGATSICVYSTRAKRGAPVSVPLSWNELAASQRPDEYTVENLPQRLASLRRDPWYNFFDLRQTITQAMRREMNIV